ncbi:unnamed protein product [Lactuca virosa]|uniref:Uncharacterized protein n=1 Tax=Lactuca virosa TaxID=75947 RepID=A0AAU9NBH0_9ASTR|nr:unnamed protein product [Lactuca virosa]
MMVVGDMRTGGWCLDLGVQKDNSVFWSRFEAEKHLRSVGSPQRRLFSTSERETASEEGRGRQGRRWCVDRDNHSQIAHQAPQQFYNPTF